MSDQTQCHWRWFQINSPTSQSTCIFEQLQTIQSPEKWLHLLVAMAEQDDHAFSSQCELYFKQALADVSTWKYFFTNVEFISYFNALFFFKTHPDQVMEQHFSPEKLSSVSERLDHLYKMIEQIQVSLQNHCLFHKRSRLKDLLLHGDILPVGVHLNQCIEKKSFVMSLLKRMQHPVCTQESVSKVHFQVASIHSIYKYWFNPSGWVDFVMGAQQDLLSNERSIFQLETPVFEAFDECNTQTCLDLYGYFSNKDSRYFVWTLKAIQRGDVLEGLPNMTPRDREAVSHLLQLTSLIMEQLRKVLQERKIPTSPYPFDLDKSVITPNERNKKAVIRLLSIYDEIRLSDNQAIEDLFNQFERSMDED